MLHIYVDADACPVKDETYRVAARYGLPVTVVANRGLFVPPHQGITLQVVGDALDAADDWIADRAEAGDVVITADLPLASRCLARGARVLGPRGREHTPDTIGDSLAGRELSDRLRQMGVMTGGPAPMVKQSRSRFLSRLDEIVNAQLREHGK